MQYDVVPMWVQCRVARDRAEYISWVCCMQHMHVLVLLWQTQTKIQTNALHCSLLTPKRFWNLVLTVTVAQFCDFLTKSENRKLGQMLHPRLYRPYILRLQTSDFSQIRFMARAEPESYEQQVHCKWLSPPRPRTAGPPCPCQCLLNQTRHLQWQQQLDHIAVASVGVVSGPGSFVSRFPWRLEVHSKDASVQHVSAVCDHGRAYLQAAFLSSCQCKSLEKGPATS